MLHAIARRIVRPDSLLRFSRVKFSGVVKCPPPVHHYIRQMPGSRNCERGRIPGGFSGGIVTPGIDSCINLITARREGNWQLPFIYAYDHTNYLRYLPVYLFHMLPLSDTHPGAYDMLFQCDLSVQRTSCHVFSQVAFDQTIEQTLINRNT